MTDAIGICNADSRKSDSKFSGLRWFFLFEDLYNGQGSLQANKTSKKQKTEFKLKTDKELQSYSQFL